MTDEERAIEEKLNAPNVERKKPYSWEEWRKHVDPEPATAEEIEAFVDMIYEDRSRGKSVAQQ